VVDGVAVQAAVADGKQASVAGTAIVDENELGGLRDLPGGTAMAAGSGRLDFDGQGPSPLLTSNSTA
jgi:hypothetical protein